MNYLEKMIFNDGYHDLIRPINLPNHDVKHV